MNRPKNKEEYRAELADAFAHILEEKGLEWKKGWSSHLNGPPRNGITDAPYRGCNALYLRIVSMMKGYEDPRWVTMVQIIDKDNKYHPNQDWHLKKGSKAEYVEYWFPYDLTNKNALTWDKYKTELTNGRNEYEFTFFTRYTAVFNAHNVEGMPELKHEARKEVAQDELIQKLSEGLGVKIFTDGGDNAYYSPSMDEIHLPKPEHFHNGYAFNATALHELSHSTGHFSRLNRIQSTSFGSVQYAYEELVAEMCSCFMGSELQMEVGPEHIENHKAYVQSWIQEIKDKPETLIKAIKDAQAAASYMDYKAGLITERDYEKARGSVMEVSGIKSFSVEKEEERNKVNERTINNEILTM